jgi:hypothetical protein
MRVAAVTFLLAAACAHRAAAPRPPEATPLPLGKADQRLDAGRYRSPDGFTPRLTLMLNATGWQSIHRYEDFFDVGRPEPGKDVPRLAIAFSHASRPSAADVIADIRAAQPAVTESSGVLAQRPATVLDLVGGTGEAYRSGNLGLDADTGQHLRFSVADVDDTVLVVAVIVPDEKNWPAESAAATLVLASLAVAP